MDTIENKEAADKISRQEAIKKAGKYAAFTAAAAVILLVPKAAQAQSAEPTGMGSGFNRGSGPTPSGDGNSRRTRSPFTKDPPPTGDSRRSPAPGRKSPWQ